MNLLDPNINIIMGKTPKSNWSLKRKALVEPSWYLKDEQGSLIGKYFFDDRGAHNDTLYQSDDSILLKFHFTTEDLFVSNVEIRGADDNLLSKISRKLGLIKTTVTMENSKGEKVLECKQTSDCHILDKNGKIVAKLKTKWLKKDWTLQILEPHFDRMMIIGLSLALLSMSCSDTARMSLP